MDNQKKIAGIIPNTDVDISFFSNNFVFTFVPNKVLGAGETFTLPFKDGFLYGETHNANRVAIYTGSGLNGIELQCALETNVPMYLISDVLCSTDDICHFDSIVFQGGILNSLTSIRAANVQRQNGTALIERKIDQQRFTFQTNDGKCTVSILQYTNETWSAAADKTSFCKNVQLSLVFEKPQPISSIRKHYHNVKLLIAVMTNRQDNHFDNMYITPIRQNDSSFHGLTHMYIYDNEVTNIENLGSYVLFEDLGEGVARLLELFYMSEDNQHSYSLGFIPNNEEERWNIDEDTIRSICSALECEEAFYDEIENEQTKPLEELCEKVKESIQLFKQNNPNASLISERTYSVINTSISYWSMSAYEKAIWMLKRFEKPIHLYIGQHSPMIQESEVHDFIKFRNSISHGTYRKIDHAILRTAEIMEILVFCSLFHRIGVPDETIERLCERTLRC